MGRKGRHCIMFAPAIIWRWLAGSKAGRMAALTGSALLAVALLYRKGRRDAEQAAERDALQGYADTRKTADDALRASDGDTRPVDERLDEHGRLRDEQAHGHGGGTAHPHRLHTPRSQPADAICDGLRPALPTWSRRDTEQSKTQGARFLDVWDAVCKP